MNKEIIKYFFKKYKIKEGYCPFCKQKVEEKDFRDENSRTEYKISGLCQKCQDEVFE